MTIKRKVRNDVTGETEIVDQKIGGPLVQALTGSNGFRILMLILVASMHPAGRQLLGTFGFRFPDERNLVVAVEEAKVTKSEITAIGEAVKELRGDIASIKANNAIVNSKVDSLDQTFRGFQIDFAKWKALQPKTIE